MFLPAVSRGGLRWGFFFFGWDGWLISLRFVFGAWGGSLGASVRANVRVCLAGSARGRFYLECTVGGPVVYMGRNKNGRTKRAYGARIFVSCLDKQAVVRTVTLNRSIVSLFLSIPDRPLLRTVGKMHTSNPITSRSLTDSLGFINRGEP